MILNYKWLRNFSASHNQQEVEVDPNRVSPNLVCIFLHEINMHTDITTDTVCNQLAKAAING